MIFLSPLQTQENIALNSYKVIRSYNILKNCITNFEHVNLWLLSECLASSAVHFPVTISFFYSYNNSLRKVIELIKYIHVIKNYKDEEVGQFKIECEKWSINREA